MLVTLEALKKYLGIDSGDTSQDEFLNAQIALFTSAIENYCSRIFTAKNYLQTYYASDYRRDGDSKELWCRQYPVNSIASVNIIETINGVDNTRPLSPSEYRMAGLVGKVFRTCGGMYSLWFRSLGANSRVEVAYNAGYAEVPLEIQSVVFSLIAERYNKKNSGIDLSFGSDVQRLSIPGVMSIDFDYTLQTNERSAKYGTLLGNYVNVLDAFRSERVMVGSIKEVDYVVTQP